MAETISELLVSLNLDATNFDRNITQANRSIKSLDKGFKESQKAIKLNENSLESYSKALKTGENLVEAYKNKMEILGNSYNKHKKNLEGLIQRQRDLPKEISNSTESLKELASTVGKGSEQYKTAKADLDKLKAEFNGMDKSISNAVNSLRNVENQIQDTSNKIKLAEKDVDKLSQEMNKLNKTSLQDIGKEVEGVGNKLQSAGNKIKDVAGGFTVLSAGAGAVVGASSKMGTGFEYNMTKVGTLLDKSSNEMMSYKDTAKRMANESSQDMNEYSDALYDAVSATGDLEGSMKLTSDAGKLATGGFTDTKSAVDILTTAINGYNLSMEDSQKVSDILIQTQNKGKTTVGELSKSMGAVIPIANSVNLNMEELGASLALMTSKGIATSESATYLKSMLSELGKSGSVTDKALRELTGKGFAELKVEGYSTSEILRMLDDYAQRNGKSLKDMFGSVEAGSAALVLANEGGEEFNEMLKSMQESSGATDKAFNEMSNTAQGKTKKAFNDLKNALIEMGISMIPTVTKIAEKISELAEKFSSLNPETQETIIKFLGFVAVGAPLLSMLGSTINGIGTLCKGVGSLIKFAGKASENVSSLADKFLNLNNNTNGVEGKLEGIKGKFTGLAKFASNPLLLAGALIGLASAIGESEGLILQLQEKFGNLGLVFGGVCEFISGLFQLTMGNILNGFMLVVDLIAAVMDGPGGETIQGAFERFGNRIQLTTNEAMSKIQLETTRGMQKLREMTDLELTQMTDAMKVTLDNIPLIIQGEYDQASQAMANSLTTMNSNQLLALTNLNDTTRNLFSGIREGMTIDEIVPILTGNFERIKSTGKLNIEELKDGVSSAMETTRNQMDSKSAEGASAVSGNMAQAESAVNSATSTMASSASTGMAQVAGNMIDESGKIPPQIQSNMEQSTSTIQNALSNMAKNIEKSFNDLCYNAEHYLGRIISKSRELSSAFSSAASSISSSASSMRNSVSNATSGIISDWNRVVSTLSRKVSGSVSIQKTITTTEVTKPATFGLNPDTPSLLNDTIMPIVDFSDLRTGGSSYNITAGVANALSINKDRNDNSFKSEFKDMKKLLIKLIEVAEEGKYINVENELKLDGRVMAKGIAKYVNEEIKIMDKRQQRLGGVF